MKQLQIPFYLIAVDGNIIMQSEGIKELIPSNLQQVSNFKNIFAGQSYEKVSKLLTISKQAHKSLVLAGNDIWN